MITLQNAHSPGINIFISVPVFEPNAKLYLLQGLEMRIKILICGI